MKQKKRLCQKGGVGPLAELKIQNSGGIPYFHTGLASSPVCFVVEGKSSSQVMGAAITGCTHSSSPTERKGMALPEGGGRRSFACLSSNSGGIPHFVVGGKLSSQVMGAIITVCTQSLSLMPAGGLVPTGRVEQKETGDLTWPPRGV